MRIQKLILATAVAALMVGCAPVMAQTPAHDPAAPAADVVPPPPPPPGAIPASEWRTVSADNLMVIDTTRGRVMVELMPQIAPLHVERMKLLARAGFFDNLNWHRVIDQFMAQTGDPLGTGEGQSPYPDLKAEFTFRRGPEMGFAAVAAPSGSLLGFINALPVQTQPDAVMGTTADHKVHGWGVYCPGVAGMARDDNPDSANSQFFLMRQPYPSLDKRYTVWGVVVSGLDVVRALKVGDGDNGIISADPDKMTRVRIAADLPETERPIVQMLDTASPRFAALVAQTRAAKGADFSVCDIILPAQVTVQTSAAPAA